MSLLLQCAITISLDVQKLFEWWIQCFMNYMSSNLVNQPCVSSWYHSQAENQPCCGFLMLLSQHTLLIMLCLHWYTLCVDSVLSGFIRQSSSLGTSRWTWSSLNKVYHYAISSSEPSSFSPRLSSINILPSPDTPLMFYFIQPIPSRSTISLSQSTLTLSKKQPPPGNHQEGNHCTRAIPPEAKRGAFMVYKGREQK